MTEEELEAERVAMELAEKEEQELEELQTRWDVAFDTVLNTVSSLDTITESGELEANYIFLKEEEAELANMLNKIQLRVNREEYLTKYKKYEESKLLIRKIKVRLDVSLLKPLNSSANLSVNQSLGVTSQVNLLTSKLPKFNLPKFSGSVLEYTTFMDQFDANIHSHPDLTDVQKLQFLKANCTGQAERMMNSFPLTNDAYLLARKEIKDVYGSDLTRQIALIKVIRECKPVANLYPVEPVRDLFTTISSAVRMLEQLAVPMRTSGLFIMSTIMSKFPREISRRYNRKNPVDRSDVLKAMDFLSSEIQSAERSDQIDDHEFPIQTKNKLNKTTEKQVLENPQGSMVACLTAAAATKPIDPQPSSSTSVASYSNLGIRRENTRHYVFKCPFCEGEHYPSACERELDPKEKLKIAKDKKLCINCLRNNHITSNCRISFSCKFCGKRHHSTLCFANKKTAEKLAPVVPEVVANSNVVLTAVSQLQMMIFSAYLLKRNGEKVLIRGVLDTAAHRSYISKLLVEKLQMTAVGEYFNGTQRLGDLYPTPTAHQIYRIKIQSRHKAESLLVNTLMVDKIPPVDGLKEGEFVEQIKGFGLELAEFFPSKSTEVDILLGNDQWWNVSRPGIKRITQLIGLTNTMFGWVLNGDADQKNALKQIQSENVDVSCFQAEYPKETIFSNDVSCFQSEYPVENLWNMDAIGISAGEKTDDFIRERFENSAVRLEDGRYEVALPFNNYINTLKSNWNIALNQLAGTLKQLGKKKEYQERYKKAIQEYIDCNHAEIVKEVAEPLEMVYYIPHHPVIREDKDTTKFRVVFNASSHQKGEKSLNDALYPGPSLNPDILNCLIRFRLFKLPIIADIKKAFLQISIKEEHRDLLRFLWVKDGFFDKEFSWSNLWSSLKVLRMKVVSFGINSSPFLLCAVIRKQAKTFALEFPDETEALDESIYMDDLISGGDEEKLTIQHCINLKKILDEGQLPLVKWATNNQEIFEVLQKLDFHMRADRFDQMDKMKILGIVWDTKMDQIIIKVPKPEIEIRTKRKILSILASLFDPMGLVCPASISMKLCIQKIWQLDYAWDDVLPENYSYEVEKWLQDIQCLNEIRVRRWMNTCSNEKFNLLIYCDASPSAYGCVVYVESQNKDKNLLLAKSRITPVKKITLPRLELTAAVIGARIGDYIISNMSKRFPINEVKYFTDSMITLQWITNDKNVWKPYITNRIIEIREKTLFTQWFHIPTALNPADLLTRPMNPVDLLTNDLWWYGPRNSVQSDIIKVEMPQEDLKIKDVVLNIGIQENPVLKLINKYSNLKKLLRVTSYVLRWKFRSSGAISFKEMEYAERTLISISQKHYLPEEYEALKEDQPIKKKSIIYNLDPFVGEDNLIRVRGRLLNAPISYEEKFPIILHNDSQLTRLIIYDIHIKLLHGDTSEVLFRTRDRFWILKGRRTVRSVIYKCMVCRKYKLAIQKPPFGDLPSERLTPANPFISTGLDHLGPIYIKTKADPTKFIKSYICLFSCMVTRAVHLEVSEDLTAESFIMAFRRFAARYGYPKTVYSDNHKTFIKGKVEMEKWGNFLTHYKFETILTDQKMEWKYIPPLSPWVGGFYERMVRAVKDKLRRVFQSRMVGLEELQTVVLEITSVINSRPLCYVSESIDGGYILTPEMFLTNGMPKILWNKDLKAIKKKDLKRLDKQKRKLVWTFWSIWKDSYLKQLRNFHEVKGDLDNKNLKRGNIVLVEKTSCNPYFWPLAKILEVYPGDDSIVRVAKIITSKGKEFIRSTKHLRLLELE